MDLEARTVVRRWGRTVVSIVAGTPAALAELLLTPFLLVPGLARLPVRLTELEVRRIGRFLGSVHISALTLERCRRYIAARWLVGGLGFGVLLMFCVSVAVAASMISAWAFEGSWGSSRTATARPHRCCCRPWWRGPVRDRAFGAGPPGRRRRRGVLGAQPIGWTDRGGGWAAVRVILAEDSSLLREGLALLLAEEGHSVVAAVGTAPELIGACSRLRPDVVVTDVRMPPTHTDDGLRATLQIRREWPGIAVLVLSQYVENRYATQLITGTTGGVGYLLKDRVAQVDEFLDALARVAAGDTAFDPEVVRQLLTRTTHPLERLTPREREVLALMAQGLTNARISDELHISQSAAEKHINAIFDKLDLPPSSGLSRRVVAVVRYLGS